MTSIVALAACFLEEDDGRRDRSGANFSIFFSKYIAEMAHLLSMLDNDNFVPNYRVGNTEEEPPKEKGESLVVVEESAIKDFMDHTNRNSQGQLFKEKGRGILCQFQYRRRGADLR